MTISPYIQNLLERWGRLPISADIGYPRECPYLKEYVPRASQGLVLSDFTEVELVGAYIDRKLTRPLTDALKAKFRFRMKPHRAARFCKSSVLDYRLHLQIAVNNVSEHMSENNLK